MKSVKKSYRQFLNTDCGVKVYNAFKKTLYTEEDSLVETLDNDILQALPLLGNDLLDVCDIGGADGNRIIHILRYVHAKFHIRFRLDFIEQSKSYVDAFDPTPINNFCATSIFHSLFEETTLPRRYDLVFLIHSIFAFENGKALDKVLALPKDQGNIIVMSNAPDSFLAGLKSLIDDEYDDRRYEIGDLRRDLEDRGIRHSYLTFQTRWAISKEDSNDSLSTIVDWISLGGYPLFSTDKKRLVSEYITENSSASGRRILFTENEAVIVIPPL